MPNDLPSTLDTKTLISGTSTMLLGAPGAGKTWSLTTLIEAGIELFVIITDPGGEETLLDAMEKKNLPIDKLHWQYIAPAPSDWQALIEMSKKIGAVGIGYEDLTKIKTGIAKQKHQQFLDLLSCLANFRCARTGKEYGAVDTWGPTKALAIDSLTGINIMAMTMLIGGKPAAHQGEWGVAMMTEEKLILKLTSDLNCFFVLTAHIERETDEVGGSSKIMASALGRRLAPKLPRTFSDVILAVRDGTKFLWSTAAPNVDLKSRTLPLKASLPPDFGQIIKVWQQRSNLATSKHKE